MEYLSVWRYLISCVWSPAHGHLGYFQAWLLLLILHQHAERLSLGAPRVGASKDQVLWWRRAESQDGTSVWQMLPSLLSSLHWLSLPTTTGGIRFSPQPSHDYPATLLSRDQDGRDGKGERRRDTPNWSVSWRGWQWVTRKMSRMPGTCPVISERSLTPLALAGNSPWAEWTC